jgi:predicted nucleic acid-binding protein
LHGVILEGKASYVFCSFLLLVLAKLILHRGQAGLFLKDPKDDMVLELAVAAAECEYLVTFNEKDFEGAERFGIKVVEPKEFLKRIGELK